MVVKKIENADIAQIREIGDRLKERIKSGVVFLSSPGDDKATYMAMATADAAKHYDAGKIMKKAMDESAEGEAESPSLHKVVRVQVRLIQ